MATKTKTPKTTLNPYKYRLYDLLFKKYGENFIKGKKEISKEIGMSYSTVNHDFGIKMKDTKEIPRPRRIVYALFFNVPEKKLKK